MKCIRITIREVVGNTTWTEEWKGKAVQNLEDGTEDDHVKETIADWNNAHPENQRECVSYSIEKTKDSTAELIVDAIITDLSDRRGLRHEWDKIDDDIKEEIVATWCELVEEILDAS